MLGAGVYAINECTAFFTPKITHNPLFQRRRRDDIAVSIRSAYGTQLCHCILGPPIQNLFSGKRGGFVHIRPVDENPVAIPLADIIVFVGSAGKETVERKKTVKIGADECCVAGCFIILCGADQKIHGVIGNGVDMLFIWRLPEQGNDCALCDFRVKVQVAVCHIGLECVTGPDPPVALDAVQIKFAGIEVERISAHVINLRNLLFVAGEGCPVLQRQILVFRTDMYRRIGYHVQIPERTRNQGIACLTAASLISRASSRDSPYTSRISFCESAPSSVIRQKVSFP